jgi:hypothetical protein
MNDVCSFCGGPDACYQRRDENNEWADSCFACARPAPQSAAKKHHKPEDFTFLDEPPDPVDPVNEQNAKFQTSLFS